MVYIAKCYVGQYAPGEVFDAELPEKEMKRLLDKGAIMETGKTLEEIIAYQEDAVNMPDDGGEAQCGEEPADDEMQGEPEAPEIDVMDGISGGEEPAAEEAKPAGRRSRK